LDKLFNNHLYCIDDVGGKSKPDPAIFLYAAEKLNTKPEEKSAQKL
jgi:FMN phosphatase YigB (HAD superfamily)